MNLTQKKCTPCEGNTPKLTEKQSKEFLKQTPGWILKNNKIEKTFKFKDFKENIEFVNKIAEIAEKEQHHPDLEISYSKLKITLSTHAIKGLSENDFILATKINKL